MVKCLHFCAFGATVKKKTLLYLLIFKVSIQWLSNHTSRHLAHKSQKLELMPVPLYLLQHFINRVRGEGKGVETTFIFIIFLIFNKNSQMNWFILNDFHFLLHVLKGAYFLKVLYRHTYWVQWALDFFIAHSFIILLFLKYI